MGGHVIAADWSAISLFICGVITRSQTTHGQTRLSQAHHGREESGRCRRRRYIKSKAAAIIIQHTGAALGPVDNIETGSER